MIEIISFILFIFLFFFLLYKNVKLNIKLSSMSSDLLSKSIENTVLSDKLSESLNSSAITSDDTSAAFLKFISDSRDWAYQYIEDVQLSLNNFINDIEPEILYFDEYGVASSAYPHYHSMKKISGAYKELKKVLPEDYSENNSQEIS